MFYLLYQRLHVREVVMGIKRCFRWYLSYSYVWSNAFGNFSFNNNLSAGPYSVTVTDNNNCLWNESFLIETQPFDILL